MAAVRIENEEQIIETYNRLRCFPHAAKDLICCLTEPIDGLTARVNEPLLKWLDIEPRDMATFLVLLQRITHAAKNAEKRVLNLLPKLPPVKRP